MGRINLLESQRLRAMNDDELIWPLRTHSRYKFLRVPRTQCKRYKLHELNSFLRNCVENGISDKKNRRKQK